MLREACSVANYSFVWYRCQQGPLTHNTTSQSVQPRYPRGILLVEPVCVDFSRTISIVYCIHCIRFGITTDLYKMRSSNRVLETLTRSLRLCTSSESLKKLNRYIYSLVRKTTCFRNCSFNVSCYIIVI